MLRFIKAFFVKPTPPDTVAPYKVETPVVVEVAPALAPIVEQKPTPAKKVPVKKQQLAKKPATIKTVPNPKTTKS